MSKAILVLDEMPKECLDCDLLNGYDNSCVGGKIGYDAIYEDRIRPTWCPLKPMPKEEEIPIDAEVMYSWYLKGYNECLRLLIGEED